MSRRAPRKTYAETLRIVAGETSQRNILLRQLKGIISLATTEGAEFYVDGRLVGITPITRPIEVEAGTPCGTVRLFQNGTEQAAYEIAGAAPDTWITLTLCYGPTEQEEGIPRLSGTIDGAQLSFPISPEVTGQPYCGLSVTAVTAAVYFDDFSVSFVYDATSYPDCGTCDPSLVSCLWGNNIAASECEWIEVSGTWDGDTTTDASAIFRYGLSAPWGSLIQYLNLVFSATAQGAEVLGYICYKDATTYLAVRAPVHNSCGLVEILQDGAVLASLPVEPLATGTGHFLCLWYDGVYLRAQLSRDAVKANSYGT